MTDTMSISLEKDYETILNASMAIFIAEIGDRTFFIITILAFSYPRSAIFFGNLLSMSFIALTAALLGAAIIYLIDPLYIAIISAIGFLIQALLCFKEACAKEGEETACENNDIKILEPTWLKTFSKTAIMVFLAEWGDKSNTTIMVLSAASNPILVATGAILAFASLGLMAVSIGKSIGKYISEKYFKLAAGTFYILCGARILLDQIVYN